MAPRGYGLSRRSALGRLSGGRSTIELGRCCAASETLKDDELQMYFLLGLFRRGLGGPRDLRRQTSWGEDDWFADASAVLQRVSEAFAPIGRRGPSPTHIMRQKDLQDARWIGDEIERKRAEAGVPICGECFQPIELADAPDGTNWVHVDEESILSPHAVVASP